MEHVVPVVITPIFKATAEELFCAWTDPGIISQWLFNGENSKIESVEMDAVGGPRDRRSGLAADVFTAHHGSAEPLASTASRMDRKAR